MIVVLFYLVKSLARLKNKLRVINTQDKRWYNSIINKNG